MDADYVKPQIKLDGFNCPHCDAYAHQTWHNLGITYDLKTKSMHTLISDMTVSMCNKCYSIAIWLGDAMIYPFESTIPLPSNDMPQDVQTLYLEARNIMIFSPRASAAILRLAVEMLMPHLGAQGDDLNKKIGFLVKNGLDKKIQEALDSIRVIGNNAIHPGQISIDDNPTIAVALFNLLNIIVTSTITRDKQIKEVHDILPAGAKKAIEKRDS